MNQCTTLSGIQFCFFIYLFFDKVCGKANERDDQRELRNLRSLMCSILRTNLFVTVTDFYELGSRFVLSHINNPPMVYVHLLRERYLRMRPEGLSTNRTAPLASSEDTLFVPLSIEIFKCICFSQHRLGLLKRHSISPPSVSRLAFGPLGRAQALCEQVAARW